MMDQSALHSMAYSLLPSLFLEFSSSLLPGVNPSEPYLGIRPPPESIPALSFFCSSPAGLQWRVLGEGGSPSSVPCTYPVTLYLS